MAPNGWAAWQVVEGVLDEMGPEAVDDLDLVLDPGAVRDGERQQPPVGVVDGVVAQVGGEADAEVDEAHLDGRAVVGERAPARLDDRERPAVGEPGVEGRGGELGGWTRSITATPIAARSGPTACVAEDAMRSCSVDLDGAADVVEHPAQRVVVGMAQAHPGVGHVAGLDRLRRRAGAAAGGRR